MSEAPGIALPEWDRAYRLVSSAFPPVSVFEDILDPGQLEAAFAIESMTNDRLLDEAGVLSRVAQEDRVSGPGSTPLMAAFTHIGTSSRFTDGAYGVYYCASSIEAAIAETKFHRERFLAATQEPCLELTMRCYVNSLVEPLHDIRAGFESLHDQDTSCYALCNSFARELRETRSYGLAYNSVRMPGEECAAIFRPTAVTIPVQGPHYRYCWDGQRIEHVLLIQSI
ncbi:RES family NAD+ phosphorylase [Pseudomonas sp. EL_65y_Pfl2_R95]|uniref:RES family NAD+ phosphorylase n=1 Tax=Pseudomonas sp. EL_65y_Pfl2_R95 TaxID=3088698 RepID=UPI0030DABEE8